LTRDRTNLGFWNGNGLGSRPGQVWNGPGSGPEQVRCAPHPEYNRQGPQASGRALPSRAAYPFFACERACRLLPGSWPSLPILRSGNAQADPRRDHLCSVAGGRTDPPPVRGAPSWRHPSPSLCLGRVPHGAVLSSPHDDSTPLLKLCSRHSAARKKISKLPAPARAIPRGFATSHCFRSRNRASATHKRPARSRPRNTTIPAGSESSPALPKPAPVGHFPCRTTTTVQNGDAEHSASRLLQPSRPGSASH